MNIDMTTTVEGIDGWMYAQDRRVLHDALNTVGLPEGRILEIGSYKGLSTAILARKAKETGEKVICIDPFTDASLRNSKIEKGAGEDVYLEFRGNMKRLGLWDSIEHHRCTTDEYFSCDGMRLPVLRFCLIDGSHNSEDLRTDIEWCLACTRPGSIICVDDYNWPNIGLVCDELLKNFTCRTPFGSKLLLVYR